MIAVASFSFFKRVVCQLMVTVEKMIFVSRFGFVEVKIAGRKEVTRGSF